MLSTSLILVSMPPVESLSCELGVGSWELEKVAFQRRTKPIDELLRGAKYLGARVVSALFSTKLVSGQTEDDLILFESYLGTRLDCNPLAVFKYLQTNCPNSFKYVWVAESPEKWEGISSYPDTAIVRYRSLEHLKCAARAKYLVTNSPRSNELPSRRAQLQIQTWHGGGCYKRVGTAIQQNMPVTRAIVKRQFNRFNFFVSSSRFFTDEVIRRQYCYEGKVISCGMPRNDILITGNPTVRDNCRKQLGIKNNDLLVLFAPTWRDFGGDIPVFDVNRVKEAVSRRFRSNRVVIANRGHYFSAYSDSAFDMNLDSFNDMQSLLLACDVLITDYSSVIWDFSFTYRPCFLYVPDLITYERERGFDVDIRSWGFPLAESTDELIGAIDNFDEFSFSKKMKLHHQQLGSYESGEASEEVSKIIIDDYSKRRVFQ